MSLSSEKEISTVILIFPELSLFGQDFLNFETYTEVLDDVLSKGNPLQLEKQLNNVYFHPTYKFKDKDNQVRVSVSIGVRVRIRVRVRVRKHLNNVYFHPANKFKDKDHQARAWIFLIIAAIFFYYDQKHIITMNILL
jgi:hypothetical protein